MYLLDTHVLLWGLSEPTKLSDKQQKVFADPEQLVYLSAVSVWEITIKTQLGKLAIPDNFWEVVAEQGFRSLAITESHARAVGELPSIHNDPFDRLLIAQALEENLTILTVDSTVAQYPVPTL